MYHFYMLKLLSILTLISPSFASNEVEVHTQDRRPEMYTEDGVAKGPIIEIVDKVLSGAKLKPLYKPVPWSRTLHLAKSGSNILLVRHSMKKDREAFLEPIIYGHETRKVHFFKRKGAKLQAEDLAQVAKLKIGYRRSSFYFPDFSTDLFSKKYAVSSDKQLINMLRNERVDLIIFNHKNILLEHLKEMKLKFEDHFEEAQYHHTYLNPRFLSIPKTSKYMKYFGAINCEVYKLRKSGAITKAFESHGLSPLAQSYDDKYSKQQITNCNN